MLLGSRSVRERSIAGKIHTIARLKKDSQAMSFKQRSLSKSGNVLAALSETAALFLERTSKRITTVTARSHAKRFEPDALLDTITRLVNSRR